MLDVLLLGQRVLFEDISAAGHQRPERTRAVHNRDRSDSGLDHQLAAGSDHFGIVGRGRPYEHVAFARAADILIALILRLQVATGLDRIVIFQRDLTMGRAGRTVPGRQYIFAGDVGVEPQARAGDIREGVVVVRHHQGVLAGLVLEEIEIP